MPGEPPPPAAPGAARSPVRRALWARSTLARSAYRVTAALLGDPRDHLRRWRGLPVYVRNARRYRRAQRSTPGAMPMRWRSLFPVLADRYDDAGVASGHYFHQDLWAARAIHAAAPRRHVDVGSRVDGFIAHLLVFRDVDVVDMRALPRTQSGLHPLRADIVSLPFRDGSVESLSSLHAVEHIGLGRYGDAIDPQGSLRAMAELERVLAPGGTLYLSVPVGRERIEFDAHRVFDPRTVLDRFPGLELVEFAAVDDRGDFVPAADPARLAEAHYACGLFRLRRPGGPA